MPVSGQTPTRIHLIDSPSAKWEAGAAYPDPNDSTKLVRDVDARVTGEVDVTASTSVTIDASSNPVIAMDDDSPAGAISVSLDSSVEDGFIRDVFNESANTATLTPTSGDINDGTGAASSKTLAAGASCRIVKTSSGSPATAHWRIMKGAASGGSLVTLSDVNAASPSDKQVLAYDTASSKWTNQNVGTIALPDWLKNSPDAPPASPGTLDDEFLDANFNDNGKWTLLDGGPGGAATRSQKNSWLYMYHASNGTAEGVHAIVQAAPATPWSVVMRFNVGSIGAGASAWSAGLVVRDSSTGKMQLFKYQNQTGGTGLVVDNYTNLTTYGGAHQVAFASLTIQVTWWWKLEDNGTNFVWYTSQDGVNFWQYASFSRTSYLATPDQVGMFINAYAYALYLSVDYFRRTT